MCVTHSNSIQAIQVLINNEDNNALTSCQLSDAELYVLNDIRFFLLLPHKVQELVSGEKTPTLSFVLPAYEDLLVALKRERTTGRLVHIGHAVDVALSKLENYLNLSRKNPIYAIAMGMYYLFYYWLGLILATFEF